MKSPRVDGIAVEVGDKVISPFGRACTIKGISGGILTLADGITEARSYELAVECKLAPQIRVRSRAEIAEINRKLAINKAHLVRANAFHNERRVAQVRQALGSTYDQDPETNVIDLLSDLRHYCNAHAIDFDKACAISETHYNEEKTDD